MLPEFREFPKIARLNREIVVTEKIDGTNGCVFISDDLATVQAGSRSRWITPADDNHGFAKWVAENRHALVADLGPGLHFGEWWGQGIQRGYGLTEKRFSLFNTTRFADAQLSVCRVVPVLYRGAFSQEAIESALANLSNGGSAAVPGFMRPEGIVVFHTAANLMLKATIEKDEEWKGKQSGGAPS